MREIRGTDPAVGDEIVIYQAPGRKIEVQVRTESLWLSLTQMAILFGVNKPAISKHLKNIFASRELDREATVSKMETVRPEGVRHVRRQVEMYNLDAVISVGYRVNSALATQFRIWATQVLRDHLVKGYSVNAKRLKELHQSLKLIGQILERDDVTSDQARALLHVVTDYAAGTAPGHAVSPGADLYPLSARILDEKEEREGRRPRAKRRLKSLDVRKNGLGVQIPAPCSNWSTRVWAWVIRLPGGTPWTSQTFPPITEPRPMVTRPRIVAPE
jgi:hypothetical protein